MPISLSRRSSLSAIAAAGLWLSQATHAASDRITRLVVPYAPGTLTDTLSRLLAEELQHDLDGTVIVDNKPGANGLLGSSQVAKSPADGYTLLMGGTSTHSTAPSLYKAMPYDTDKDFQLLSILGEFDAMLVVRADSPARDLKSLAALLTGPAGKGAYGYGAAIHQVAGAALLDRLKVSASAIPYKGGVPAMTDLIGGQVDFIFIDSVGALPQIKGGKIRAIATAGSKRWQELPDVPTFVELGLRDFVFSAWLGVLAPAKVPAERVRQLQRAIDNALAKPVMQEKIAAVGRPYTQNGKTDYARFMSDERKNWAAKISAAGVQPE